MQGPPVICCLSSDLDTVVVNFREDPVPEDIVTWVARTFMLPVEALYKDLLE